MRTLFLLIAVLAVLGLCVAPAVATSAAVGAVSGVVVDHAGNAVPGAHVAIRIQDINGHVFDARTLSDRHGHFTFRPVPAGHGAVGARARGVGQGRTPVRVLPGQETRVRIVLL